MIVVRTCKHIKANGEFCGSPALRQRRYCYFHLTCAGRHLRAQKQALKMDSRLLELPPLEDANSIQVALMQVMDALVRGRITPKVYGLLLYALQIASSNLNQGAYFQQGNNVTVCGSYDSFEHDYDLADTACDLTAHDEEDEEEEAESQPTAEPEKEEAEEPEDEEEDEEDEDEGEEEDDDDLEDEDDFHCDRAQHFLCTIKGHLAERIRVPEPVRIRRDGTSQKLTLRMPPQSVPAEPCEDPMEVA
jgi:hypothetical protein